LLAACGDSGDSTTDGAGGGSTSSVTTSTGGGGGGPGTGGGGGEPPTELVHRVGRFDDTDPARPSFTWSETSFATTVDCGELSVELDGASSVFFQVVVDGVPTSVFQTTGGDATYPILSGAPSGPHDVEIHRRNEGFFGAVQFVGFVPGTGCALVPTPSPYEHRLEFIGDSITCGYGVEGADANCSFSGETESAYETYAAIASRNVKAAAHLVAYSGKGVYQNYGGDMTELMPELWLRTLTDDPTKPWDFSSFVPEAVVINLGTNDFSVAIDGDAFIGAYVDLLSSVREKYPAAAIFAVRWAHWGATSEGYVTTALDQFGDTNAYGVEFAIDSADGFGCDYHPSLVTHQKLGAQLTQVFHDTLGW
jgi:hypothetical protein